MCLHICRDDAFLVCPPQATWKGALVRHQLRHPTTTKAPFVDQIEDDVPRKKTEQYQQHQHQHQHYSRKQTTTGTDSSSSEQQERCPERAAWEQSWSRVRLGRPNFRDRVRVWQTIAELKRSGGRGRMGITNNEAWVALHESAGSALVAATRLSSEDYLLGRRLQEQNKNNVCEIPPYLSLDLASVLLVAPPRGGEPSPLLRRRRSSSLSLSSATRTSSEATDIIRGLPTKGEKGRSGGVGGTFECVKNIFYNVSTTTSTTTEGRKGRRSASSRREYSTAKYSTVQHSTAQYSTAQYRSLCKKQ